jgi:hypothetical protein
MKVLIAVSALLMLCSCSELTATKEAGGFWCLGVCAQKTVAVEVKVEGRVKP